MTGARGGKMGRSGDSQVHFLFFASPVANRRFFPSFLKKETVIPNESRVRGMNEESHTDINRTFLKTILL
jgi:hypothetical protein